MRASIKHIYASSMPNHNDTMKPHICTTEAKALAFVTVSC